MGLGLKSSTQGKAANSMFRFSLTNLLAWTLIFAFLFATSQWLGPILGTVVTGVLVLALLAYEDGLKASGQNFNGVRNFVGEISIGHSAPVSAIPEGEFVRGTQSGPALTILASAGVGVAILLASAYADFPAGFFLPWVICLLTGAIYRYRSRGWPVDPSAFRRNAQAIAASLFLFPAIVAICSMVFRNSAAYIAVAIWMGIALSIGFSVCGARRHGKLLPPRGKPARVTPSNRLTE